MERVGGDHDSDPSLSEGGNSPTGGSGRGGHTFNNTFNVVVNGGGADVANQVRQAIRQSSSDLVELMKRAEREDLWKAIASAREKLNPHQEWLSVRNAKLALPRTDAPFAYWKS
jgi:hypothetical protein